MSFLRSRNDVAMPAKKSAEDSEASGLPIRERTLLLTSGRPSRSLPAQRRPPSANSVRAKWHSLAHSLQGIRRLELQRGRSPRNRILHASRRSATGFPSVVAQGSSRLQNLLPLMRPPRFRLHSRNALLQKAHSKSPPPEPDPFPHCRRIRARARSLCFRVNRSLRS